MVFREQFLSNVRDDGSRLWRRTLWVMSPIVSVAGHTLVIQFFHRFSPLISLRRQSIGQQQCYHSFLNGFSSCCLTVSIGFAVEDNDLSVAFVARCSCVCLCVCVLVVIHAADQSSKPLTSNALVYQSSPRGVSGAAAGASLLLYVSRSVGSRIKL